MQNNDIRTACILLNIFPEDTAEIIKRKYRKKMKQYHPDMNIGSDIDFATEMAKQINWAYEYVMSHLPELHTGNRYSCSSIPTEEVDPTENTGRAAKQRKRYKKREYKQNKNAYFKRGSGFSCWDPQDETFAKFQKDILSTVLEELKKRLFNLYVTYAENDLRQTNFTYQQLEYVYFGLFSHGTVADLSASLSEEYINPKKLFRLRFDPELFLTTSHKQKEFKITCKLKNTRKYGQINWLNNTFPGASLELLESFSITTLRKTFVLVNSDQNPIGELADESLALILISLIRKNTVKASACLKEASASGIYVMLTITILDDSDEFYFVDNKKHIDKVLRSFDLQATDFIRAYMRVISSEDPNSEWNNWRIKDSSKKANISVCLYKLRVVDNGIGKPPAFFTFKSIGCLLGFPSQLIEHIYNTICTLVHCIYTGNISFLQAQKLLSYTVSEYELEICCKRKCPFEVSLSVLRYIEDSHLDTENNRTRSQAKKDEEPSYDEISSLIYLEERTLLSQKTSKQTASYNLFCQFMDLYEPYVFNSEYRKAYLHYALSAINALPSIMQKRKRMRSDYEKKHPSIAYYHAPIFERALSVCEKYNELSTKKEVLKKAIEYYSTFHPRGNLSEKERFVKEYESLS